MRPTFEPYEPNQVHLFPPSAREWLPEGHLAFFLSDTVDQLDLSPFFKKYRRRKNKRGNSPYHPAMMLKILLYSYCEGIFSSRKIAAGLDDLVPLRFLAAGNRPHHRSIARFRQENIERFKKLFVQVIRIAQQAKLVSMGTLAIDGSKVKANASKHKAMSYGRMKSEDQRLTREIRKILDLAKGVDEAEDEEFGKDFRGDELPEELRTREGRRAKIREAMARLEKEQEEEDEESGRGQHREKTGKGSKLKRPNGVPPDRKQANFTDPESRIMKVGSGGFEQCYNAQVAVDADEQIIVAAEVTSCAADSGQLLPVVTAAEQNTGQSPTKLVADAGYRSENNFESLEAQKITGFIALGRGEKDPMRLPETKPCTRRMARKLKTTRGRATYKKRKWIVEPVFGWVKRALGFRSFSMRGQRNTSGEWDLVCTALNLRRMHLKMGWS